MNIAKCAFGACAVDKKYIFAVGGYDGNARLNLIERYDLQEDKWTTLEAKLKDSLSNSACFSPKEDTIIILGGGCNHGFSYEVASYNIVDGKWTSLPAMTEGRDLRNKIVYYNGCAFVVGGNNCRAEKFSFFKNEWLPLPSYNQLVTDNLDSWACALTFDPPGRPHAEHRDSHYPHMLDEDLPATIAYGADQFPLNGRQFLADYDYFSEAHNRAPEYVNYSDDQENASEFEQEGNDEMVSDDFY
eukprot:TRINITY_DN8538_c0_g1_i1.p1 TRINITY_DN8538_c0_g1~~TRINITY_DN8538_c0_g1_i1.p1  ORF type:complete len:244 (+),score=37.30 TRINITY_DN8538_c0_g1_i1:237-968(+)